jgi:hypothetical protein
MHEHGKEMRTTRYGFGQALQGVSSNGSETSKAVSWRTMFSRGGKHALASSSNVREMKPPATTSFHAKSSPVLALAVDKLNEDKQLEEVPPHGCVSLDSHLALRIVWCAVWEMCDCRSKRC